ncbi:nucleotidyltransferase family protein [Granulicella sp. WH15]|nr:nucleotidyltransferase family protein [Granulicella sp. WH15]
MRDDAASTLHRLSREQQIHKAVLLSFAEPVPYQVELLLHLTSSQWRSLLHWLDISGLALYLLDRLAELGLHSALPPSVLQRLQQNMDDNTQRTRGMIDESVALQLEFQKAGLSYAVMKGVSLSPVSVPSPELRHQFDLDYLIAERHAPEAQQILERRGYRLYAVSGKSWEFKTNAAPYVSMKDFYKDLPSLAVELHLEAKTSESSRLHRIVHREICGITMPVFSPVDLFLAQGLHAFKDVCSAFSRSAHLLEFYRHILARRDDTTFWRELRAAAESDLRTTLGIGIVTYLITSVMGDFAPAELTSWTVATLPPSIRLWVDLYGQRTIFGSYPGTKLYLLLQKELEIAGITGKRPLNQLLLPSRLPLPVRQAVLNETLSTRISRYCMQIKHVLARLRFHIVEGLRYAIERHRWRQHLDRLPL